MSLLQQFSFIHCADVHLGHQQFNEPQRFQDFADAFQQVVTFALDKKVDFVLISGDFFHKRSINSETLGQAVELLNPLKAADIPVIAIEGNHDKAFYQDRNSWLQFLNKLGYLFLLIPEFEEGHLVLRPWNEKTRTGSWLDLPQGVRIYGLSYLGITTSTRLPEIQKYLENQGEEKQYSILLLHAAINRLMGQDLGGIKKEILEPFRSYIDYVALGHIHSRYEVDNWLFNPGSLECVHLDEYGPDKEKGFYYVTVKGKETGVKHIPSTYRPVYRQDISLTESSCPDDAYEIIYKQLKEQSPPSEAQVQLILQGKIQYSPLKLDMRALSEKIKIDFSSLYVEILNNTNLPEEQNLQGGTSAKREEIEKLVFAQLLGAEHFLQEEELDTAVKVVQDIKEMSLLGESQEEIIELLLHYGENLITDNSDDEQELPYKEGVER